MNKKRMAKVIITVLCLVMVCMVCCLGAEGCNADKKSAEKTISLQAWLTTTGKLNDAFEIPGITGSLTYQYNYTKDRVEVTAVTIKFSFTGFNDTFTKKWSMFASPLVRDGYAYTRENVALNFRGDNIDRIEEAAISAGIQLAIGDYAGALVDIATEAIVMLVDNFIKTGVHAYIAFWDYDKQPGVSGDEVWLACETNGATWIFEGRA